MSLDQFQVCAIPPEAEALRGEVRAFLADALAAYPATARAQSWMGYDADFSRKLGRRGWIGMTWPREYGGSGQSAFARYVVVEELLAAGAPVSAHWFADRQTGPLLLRYGTEAQKRKYLPAICQGDTYFCIGMSEPDSGSDLASIRSRARPDGDGWVLNGAKLWTTNAHRSHYMIALVRTGEGGSQRQEGLSQMVIDLRAPGVTVRSIRDLGGSEHFNEVVFQDVRLGADALVGIAGQGWQQVVAELAFERSGPERYLSSIALLTALIDRIGYDPDSAQAIAVGRLVARLAVLRQMSIAVTGRLQAGEDPAWAASCVKDLGTGFEQDIPELAQALLDLEPAIGGDGDGDYEQILAYLIQAAPSFSLRGGTREILRGIIARGLGLR